jgi:hypothetical protein
MQKNQERAVRALSLAAVVLATAVFPLHAVETRFWQQDELSDFEKGNLNKISIRSDGRLLLAPAVSEILDSSTPYLWAVARDSKGNIYAGGGGPTGSTAKLFEIAPGGKSTVAAELEGLEIHAIAIDSHDRVYAATVPDGKVYRVVNGKAEVFFDPHAKYIWAMAFSRKGDLYIATGDRGEIYKVAPDGQGSVFFKTEETHARSLAIDPNDNLIVGTEPSGIIIRVSPAGEGFVLYETPKREITAVAVGKDGSIYAAAVGNKTSPFTAPPAPSTTATPAPASPGAATGPVPVTMQPRPSTAPPPTLAGGTPSVTGGSEVYLIAPDGAPRRIWSHSQDIAYTLAIDEQGHPLVGTGNKGNIYRLDSDLIRTLLVNLAPTQVTGFASGPRGELFAATGNIGKVYRIGPELEKTGSYESDPFDASAFTYWGRLSYSGDTAGGRVSFEARSGNVNHPQKNWSKWSQVTLDGDGGRVAAPPARFLQYRATLTAGPGGKSPELTEVDIAYMAKNIAPLISEIESTPPNFRFSGLPINLAPSTPQTLTLPALGGNKRTPSAPSLEITPGQTMQYAKGYTGARWAAQDDNGDRLTFKVEIRGVSETNWQLLRDDLREKQISWDSTSYADGKYVLRVTASDAPSNPPAEALTAQIVSDPFLIDNSPPQITGLTAIRNGEKIEVRWRAKDAGSIIDHAEYSLNGGDWTVAEPVTRLSDARELDYKLTLDRPKPGEFTVAVRVVDEYDNQSVEKTVVK